MKHRRIIVALDSSNLNQILRTVKLLKNEVYAFKIGYEFFFNFGINGYKKVYRLCPKIFLDLKLHDIPNTVKKGIIAINKLKPLMTTIHISGGDEMMRETNLKSKVTKILGVSILTSLSKRQTKKYYKEDNINLLVKNFAKEAKKNKIDGIVCSPKEIKTIRKVVGNKFLIVTPGIRLERKINKLDDQKRVLSPKEAVSLGADYLVIGRPITKSQNPLKKIKTINDSLN